MAEASGSALVAGPLVAKAAGDCRQTSAKVIDSALEAIATAVAERDPLRLGLLVTRIGTVTALSLRQIIDTYLDVGLGVAFNVGYGRPVTDPDHTAVIDRLREEARDEIVATLTDVTEQARTAVATIADDVPVLLVADVKGASRSTARRAVQRHTKLFTVNVDSTRVRYPAWLENTMLRWGAAAAEAGETLAGSTDL